MKMLAKFPAEDSQLDKTAGSFVATVDENKSSMMAELERFHVTSLPPNPCLLKDSRLDQPAGLSVATVDENNKPTFFKRRNDKIITLLIFAYGQHRNRKSLAQASLFPTSSSQFLPRHPSRLLIHPLL